jgi:hypothetical protein
MPGGRVAADERERPWRSIGGAVAVAVAAVLFLALRQARSYDEMFTWGEIDHGTLAGVWHSYRHTADATPPAGYVVFWVFGRVIGTGRVAMRIPTMASWAVATGCASWFLRRARPWAAFVGGLAPTASALVGLGMFARPYGMVVAAVGVAMVVWQRTLDRPGGRWAPVLLGVSLAVAVLLQYAAIAAVIAFGVAELFTRRRSPARSRAVIWAIVASLASVGLVIPLLSDATHIQSNQPHNVSVTNVPAFYVSTARPAVLVVLAVLAGLALVWRRPAADALAEGRVPAEPARADALRTEELVLGAGLAVIVPVFAVAAMWVTSGYYAHRYAAPALLGAAILMGAAVDLIVRRFPFLAVVLVALALVSVAFATWHASFETPSDRRMSQIVHHLGLPDPGEPVVFLDPHQFLLADEAVPSARSRDWRVDGPYAAPGTAPDVVDVTAVVERAAAPVVLVGDGDAVSELAAQHHWRVRVIARDHLDYDEAHHQLVSALVSR